MKTLATLSLIAALCGPLRAEGERELHVYKTRTCGCCGKWVQHMTANGFTVKVHEVDSTVAAQKENGVPDNLHSCHTAVVQGYTLEGHVPATDVARLLKTRPRVKGLAVPGMPAGSPGMEGPRKDAYSVLSFDAGGETKVFQKYPGD